MTLRQQQQQFTQCAADCREAVVAEIAAAADGANTMGQRKGQQH